MRENSKSWHGLLDTMGALSGALIYRNKRFFNESLDTKPISEVVPKTAVGLESIEHDDWQTLTANSPIGQFSGKYLVYKWHGNNAPTICFIHGSGEQPYNFGKSSSNSFRKIFTKEFEIKANLILLMAPFHDSTQHDYIKALGSLENYVGMLATTTAILNALALRLRLDGLQKRIYAVGVSLGGWVVNLHRAYYRNNIDTYIPMIAGTSLYDVFATSQYSRLTANNALQSKELLKETLAFESDFLANKNDDCFPLLARFDKLVELDVQKNGYKDLDLKIIDKGHFTGMEAVNEMRNHITDVILSRA